MFSVLYWLGHNGKEKNTYLADTLPQIFWFDPQEDGVYCTDLV